MAGKNEINIEDTLGKKSGKDHLPQKKSMLKRLLTLKMIIIYCVVLLLVAGCLFAGWFFFLKGNDKAAVEKAKQAAQKNQAGKQHAEKKKKPRFKDVVELAPFVKIKLQPSGKFSSITMYIALKLANSNMRKSIVTEKKRIRRIIIRETGKMTWLVLRNPQGKLRLKYRLIASINSLLEKSSGSRIKNLYFTHFIMQ